MKKLQEIEDYRQFTGPAELHKAINTLKGIVAGITTDHQISKDEVNELSFWCVQHANLIKRHPFNELIPMIQSAYQDGMIEESEAADIVWLCNNFISDAHYYDLITSGLQFLSGLIHGILADGIITDSEIYTLQTWMSSNEYLTECYPFDEIESVLTVILRDGKITDDERDGLKAFLSNFIDLKHSYNLSSIDMDDLKNKYSIKGICAVDPEIVFENNLFCFTGQSIKASRNEIASIVTEHGGVYKNNITNGTRYLVVGNDGNPCWAYSCYGRKVESAIERRKKGQRLIIVNEVDFWDALW